MYLRYTRWFPRYHYYAAPPLPVPLPHCAHCCRFPIYFYHRRLFARAPLRDAFCYHHLPSYYAWDGRCSFVRCPHAFAAHYRGGPRARARTYHHAALPNVCCWLVGWFAGYALPAVRGWDLLQPPRTPRYRLRSAFAAPFTPDLPLPTAPLPTALPHLTYCYPRRYHCPHACVRTFLPHYLCCTYRTPLPHRYTTVLHRAHTPARCCGSAMTHTPAPATTVLPRAFHPHPHPR